MVLQARSASPDRAILTPTSGVHRTPFGIQPSGNCPSRSWRLQSLSNGLSARATFSVLLRGLRLPSANWTQSASRRVPGATLRRFLPLALLPPPSPGGRGAGHPNQDRKVRMRLPSVSVSRVSQSQTIITCQPQASSSATLAVSRSLFLASFGSQYPVFDFGIFPSRQSAASWPCQKQP